MKKISTATLILCALCLGLHAQSLNQVGSELPVIAPYSPKSSGPHDRKWERVTIDALGRTNTQSYTELASGLNFWSAATGKWEPTREEFQITDNGYAVATNGQHKAIIAPDIASSPAIDLLCSDEQRLASNPRALAFRDPASGKTALVASVTNCIGELVEPNMVVFPRAFDTVRAALRYSYKRSGLEQDVIFYQQLPRPEAFGCDPSTSVLEIWTEFTNSPAPAITSSPGTDDPTLRFGQTKMGHGFAYLQDAQGRSSSVPLQKSWVTIDGRTFLIEAVRYSTIKPLLDKLQASAPALKKTQTAKVIFPNRDKLVAQAFRRKSKPIRMASIRPGALSREVAVVADYQTLNGSLTDYTFAADETYFIASDVSVSGTATFEGNTVIKFTNSESSAVLSADTFVCKTGPYKMAILTSKDDDSVGASITGSTGSPTNGTGIYLIANYESTYQYLRLSYAGIGIWGCVDKVNNSSVWDCQFLKCGTAMLSLGGGADLHNVLFSQCDVGVQEFFFCVDLLRGEHVTADAVTTLFDSWDGDGALTNTILTAVTTPGPITVFDHCVTNASSAGFYQSAGAGNYYLSSAAGTNRNAGTTNISSALLTELKHKTTYPPVVCSNVTWTANTTLTPQAQRITGIPDIGFSYDPIDYITHMVSVTNSSVTLAPGTAVACYNGTGLWLQEGSTITSIGTPLAPNWFVRYQSVQEQSTPLGGNPPSSGFGANPYHTGTSAPVGTFRFSRFACPANGGNHFYDTSWSFGALLLQNSEVWGGANRISGASNSVGTVVNNLFNRGTLNSSSLKTNSLAVSNNLFWAVTTLRISPVNSNLWSAFNNEFDSCTFSASDSIVVASGNNAFYNCNNQLTRTNASDITLTNAISYKSGRFGDFYQPTNSSLINHGSCTADLAGLYQYTVSTNIVSGAQIKETNSVVDIGLHYVATDSSGLPLDYDGDGIPDYLEDLTGNGSYDSSAGETDWLNYNSINSLAAGTGLQVFTPLK